MSHNQSKFCLILLTLCGLTEILCAQNQSIFVAGKEQKLLQIYSAIPLSGGGAAVFSNPAYLGAEEGSSGSRDRPSGRSVSSDIELGYGLARYSYKRKEYDPVNVRVRSPLFGAGLVANHPDVSFGLYVLPEKASTVFIPGLPIESDSATSVFAVKSREQAVSVGTGVAVHVSRRFHVGASAIYSYEKKLLEVSSPNEGPLFVRMDGYSHILRPVLGFVHQIGDEILWGGAYLPEQLRMSQGSIYRETTKEIAPIDTQIYLPPVLRSSVQWKRNSGHLSLHLNRLLYGRGGQWNEDGVQTVARQSDLHDVWETGLTAGFDFAAWKYLLGVSYHPSPWGEGKRASDPDGKTRVQGAEFGHIDALDRWSLGVGSRTTVTPIFDSAATAVFLGASYATGKRSVGDVAAGYGDYSFSFALLQTGVEVTW